MLQDMRSARFFFRLQKIENSGAACQSRNREQG
jgi:hypothetical protein